MRLLYNGKYVDMEIDAISALEKEYLANAAAERTRPLTSDEVSALLIRQQINTLDVDDNTALRMTEFYPEWAADVDYTAGYKVQHGGRLWRCLQAHTAQSGWEPSTATASL